MFHLINKVWVDILARQIKDKKIKNCLCVYTNDQELTTILNIQSKYKVYIATIPADYIKYQLYNDRKYGLNTETKETRILEEEVYDDILISHDLYDIFTKDYLAKHCRRINKNLK